MLTWLKTWFTPPPEVAPPSVRALARRLDDLEDDVAHLRKRVTSLTGRVTGAIRTDSDEPAGPEINKAIQEGRFSRGVPRKSA